MKQNPRRISLDRKVALKVLPPQFVRDETAVARFRREARAAAALQNNHLVQVYDYGEEEGVYYYVMELIRGESLDDLLRRHARLDEGEVIQIAHQTLLGLEAAHQAGIVHRDVKPDNLMLTQGGRIKVADLGLARSFHDAGDTALTQTGVAMGTPHYVSPEQLREGGVVDHRSDFYALGATLYHLATGQPPFPGRSVPEVMACHLYDPPPRARDVNPSLSEGLSAFLQRLMAKNPEERPATHREIYDALERCQQRRTAPAPAGKPERKAKRKKAKTERPAARGPALWAIGTGVVLAAAVGASIVFTGGRGREVDSKSVKPALATREAPFVNSLGMRFVPVSIVGGPTGSATGSGRKVLFSVWETRRRDYRVFALETGRKWPEGDWHLAGFKESPDHPAVLVSWEDASAFCAWLTRRERDAGRIGPNDIYRLPSDHEWSCAVGIGGQEDPAATPQAKAGKLPGFPWGREWPPPKGIGNFYGEEAKRTPWSGGFTIAGYSDPFPRTAPVGSFRADKNGLFDLSGNVWEWCLEKNGNPQSPRRRVMRGGSWWRKTPSDMNSGPHISSNRSCHLPQSRTLLYGFRCVLVASKPSR